MVICQPNVVPWKDFILQMSSRMPHVKKEIYKYSQNLDIRKSEVGRFELGQWKGITLLTIQWLCNKDKNCYTSEHFQFDMIVFCNRKENSSSQDFQYLFLLVFFHADKDKTEFLVVMRQNEGPLPHPEQLEKTVAEYACEITGKSDREKNMLLLQNNLAVNISISNISFSRN